MQPLQVEREARSRERSPEPPHQLVVAPAAAEHVPERGIVDLEDGARVVAEVPEQAQVDADPLGDAASRERFVGGGKALGGPLHRPATQLAGAIQRLRTAAEVREPQQRFPLAVADRELIDLRLQPDQVVLGQHLQDAVAAAVRDAQLIQELAVEISVTQADHRPRQSSSIQRRAQDLDHLGGPVRRLRPDQLHAGLGELAHLASLGTDRPVGARDVAEPERRLGADEPRRRQAGDRDRHVGAHRQQLAALVEEAVRGGRAAVVAAREHLVVLDRRRRHLAVAEPFEGVGQRRFEAPQLPHLVGKHISSTRWNPVGHRGKRVWASDAAAVPT